MDLEATRVLLTGATGGIGQALARRLVSEGATPVLTGRRTEVLAPLATELGVETIAADLGTQAGLETVLDKAGRIDVLIANAALPAVGLLHERTREAVDADLDVNLRSPIHLAQALLPGMLDRRRGHLVFIGSVSGIVASPGSTLYNATKFGLRGFADALRQDLHGTGVSASIVEPGFVSEAGMFVESRMQVPKGTRLVTPEQVAAGVVKAITKDRGEVVVAPFELRVGARLGAVSPSLNALIQRRAGAAEIIKGHASAR